MQWRHPAQRRLAFEELLAYQLSLKLLRQRIQSDPGWPLRIDAALQERGLKSRMTLQVHDELVFEVPEGEVDTMQSLVREQMEKAQVLAVPLLVEMGVGTNWRDLD